MWSSGSERRRMMVLKIVSLPLIRQVLELRLLNSSPICHFLYLEISDCRIIHVMAPRNSKVSLRLKKDRVLELWNLFREGEREREIWVWKTLIDQGRDWWARNPTGTGPGPDRKKDKWADFWPMLCFEDLVSLGTYRA